MIAVIVLVGSLACRRGGVERGAEELGGEEVHDLSGCPGGLAARITASTTSSVGGELEHK